MKWVCIASLGLTVVTHAFTADGTTDNTHKGQLTMKYITALWRNTWAKDVSEKHAMQIPFISFDSDTLVQHFI